MPPYIRGGPEAMDQNNYRSFISQGPIACFKITDLDILVFWHLEKMGSNRILDKGPIQSFIS
jgi:hypothetical protein